MALVVLLRGVNVGGHRSFRPTQFVQRLRHLDILNIGATGTFVVRRRIGRAQLREEIAGELPFEASITICDGGEIAALLTHATFASTPKRPEIVRFVSVLSWLPRSPPKLPIVMPSHGAWLLKVLARDGRFVLGVYRRQMKAIGCLSKLDDLFGSTATTRSWSTIVAIAKAPDAEA